jgi:hypothetical protein
MFRKSIFALREVSASVMRIGQSVFGNIKQTQIKDDLHCLYEA